MVYSAKNWDQKNAPLGHFFATLKATDGIVTLPNQPWETFFGGKVRRHVLGCG
jgi:hypothetical protein